MFQTAFVYTSVVLECSNKVVISKDTRLRMYFHGDLSVCICVNIYVCMCLYTCARAHTHTHTFLYIYECPRKKNLQTQRVQRDPRPWEVAGTDSRNCSGLSIPVRARGLKHKARDKACCSVGRIGADTCSSGTFGGWPSQWKRVLIKDLYPPSSKHKEVYPSCSSVEDQSLF